MASGPTQGALRRLARDVRAVRNGSLAEQGVFYAHDSDNVLKGYAVVIGGEGTPYEDGCYEFEFTFPVNYPHEPPTVKFVTGDGRTRLNPNLYRNGKVCLSVLNTWQGPQWTGCQTIASVLLSLRANVLAVAEPLLNEPGIGKEHRDFNNYHQIVCFKNKEIAIWGLAVAIAEGKSRLPGELRSIVARHLNVSLPKLKSSVYSLATSFDKRVLSTGLYAMEILIDYPSLASEIGKRIGEVGKTLSEVGQIDV